MEQTADRLEREVWPVANARQFVLTFPLQVRHRLARSPELLSDVILNVTTVIKEFYEEGALRGADVDDALMPTNGAITFVQLFGSALILNLHLHMIFLDGVFTQTLTGTRFCAHPTFDTDCVLGILHAIYHRPDHLFKRLGYITDDGDTVNEPPVEEVPLPFKPRAPKGYRRLGTRSPRIQSSSRQTSRCCRFKGGVTPGGNDSASTQELAVGR